MKKLFALLSLIAMLTVVFTSQTLANDHKVVMAIHTKFHVAVDTVNYEAKGGVDKPDIVSRDFYTIIFKAEMIDTWKDCPFEVGWTIGNHYVITKSENQIIVRKDLPFEVGWTK